MPDLISLPRHVVSRGHPEPINAPIPGFPARAGNDNSIGDNLGFASPKGEGFPPSPIEALNNPY